MKPKTYHKFLMLLMALFTGVAVNAQTTAPTATERAADELCAKLNAYNLDTKTGDEITKFIQDETVKVFANNMKDLMAEMGIDNMNGDNGRKIGEEIGRKLLLRCPKFIQASAKMSDDEPSGSDEASGNAIGMISKINSPDFVQIVLKDATGRETTFYWLHYFKGSEKFEAETNSTIGKKVKIGWAEMEFYLPKAHSYYKIKEIKSIEILN